MSGSSTSERCPLQSARDAWEILKDRRACSHRGIPTVEYSELVTSVLQRSDELVVRRGQATHDGGDSLLVDHSTTRVGELSAALKNPGDELFHGVGVSLLGAARPGWTSGGQGWKRRPWTPVTCSVCWQAYVAVPPPVRRRLCRPYSVSTIFIRASHTVEKRSDRAEVRQQPGVYPCQSGNFA